MIDCEFDDLSSDWHASPLGYLTLAIHNFLYPSVERCTRTVTIYTGLPRSMPNADQSGIDPNVNQFRSMIGIDRH